METPENNNDILNDLEIIAFEADAKKDTEADIQDFSTNLEENTHKVICEEEINSQEEQVQEVKKQNIIIKNIIFLFKYVLTSSLIFWILMVSANYSAYLNIGKSYIYKEKIETESKWLISSVEASNITEKVQEKIKIDTVKKKKQEEEQQNEDEIKGSEYSINKLIALSNKKDINLDIEITPYENRIVIPKIWKNIPLVDIKNRKIEWEEELNSIFMEELENGVIRYPGSSTPGNDGTTFIFWHSSNFPWIKWDYNEVFARLDQVQYNDDIIIYYWQKKFIYRIREKKVIKPGDVSFLKRNKKKSELTLMTCWPIWTTLKRLVVTWELIEEV